MNSYAISSISLYTKPRAIALVRKSDPLSS
jgi:hypothetical protein